MVSSILNPKINYPEIKYLDPEDKKYDASMYSITVLNMNNIIIALGQAKYNFIDDNIIYFPIYLVKNERVNTQIGVYEIMSEQLINITDEDNDIELDRIDSPLLYSFVTPELIANSKETLNMLKKENTSDKDDDKDDNDDNDDDNDDDDKDDGDDEDDDEDDDDDDDEDDDDTMDGDEDDNTFFPDGSLPEQNEKQAEEEINDYKEEKKHPWIQKYLKSNYYNLIDNEGGGDCLFSVIRDALKANGKEVTVLELRSKLANEVTEELFNSYKELYDMHIQNIKDTSSDMTDLKKHIVDFKERLRNSKDRNEQETIVDGAKKLANKYTTAKSEREISTELMHEFRFMKNIRSVEDLKKIIKTCEFWGDTWAISTLERVLNIKLVIFSSEAWDEGDKSNVLQCGQLNDPVLEEKGVFEPQYYILLDYTGDHYKLITYKHHRLFTFIEIPYNIKLLVANKCLERLSGPYSIIPQFKLFNEQIGIEEPIELDIEIIEEQKNDLYDDNIVFQYYIKSNNKPLPGKGIGEKIPVDMIPSFSSLSKIPEWRRKLDNEYIAPFELDGHKWNTVEHYYQAGKFKNTNKEFYLLFSLDSNSKMSLDVDMAKAAASKNGKYKKEQLRPKDIKIDDEFYKGIDEKLLEDSLYAKFSQNKDMKEVLVNTKQAKLMLYKQGTEPELSNILMIVRNRM